MAEKKAAPLYADLAKPDEAGHQHFEGEDSLVYKAGLSRDSDRATYEDLDVPHQSVQKLGSIEEDTSSEPFENQGDSSESSADSDHASYEDADAEHQTLQHRGPVK